MTAAQALLLAAALKDESTPKTESGKPKINLGPRLPKSMLKKIAKVED